MLTIGGGKNTMTGPTNFKCAQLRQCMAHNIPSGTGRERTLHHVKLAARIVPDGGPLRAPVSSQPQASVRVLTRSIALVISATPLAAPLVSSHQNFLLVVVLLHMQVRAVKLLRRGKPGQNAARVSPTKARHKTNAEEMVLLRLSREPTYLRVPDRPSVVLMEEI